MTIFLAIVIPLFVSLIAYAASLTLKHIKYRGTIKDLNETLTAARAELATFDEKKNQEISDIKKMSVARITELTETNSMLATQLSEYTKFKHQSGLLRLNGDQVPFCPDCWEDRRKAIHLKHHHKLMDDGKPHYHYFCTICSFKEDIYHFPH